MLVMGLVYLGVKIKFQNTLFLIVTLSLSNLKVHLLPLKAQKQASPSTSPDVVDVTKLVIIVVDSVRMARHRFEAGPQIASNHHLGSPRIAISD